MFFVVSKAAPKKGMGKARAKAKRRAQAEEKAEAKAAREAEELDAEVDRLFGHEWESMCAVQCFIVIPEEVNTLRRLHPDMPHLGRIDDIGQCRGRGRRKPESVA